MMVDDDCCCVVSLAVECVRGDDLAGEVPESLEQRAHRVELAGGPVVADLGLADDRTGVVEHAREQLHLVWLDASRAPQPLAVDRDPDQRIPLVDDGAVARFGRDPLLCCGDAVVREPAADDPVEAVRVQAGEAPADGVRRGWDEGPSPLVPLAPELGQDVLGELGRELADRVEARSAGEHRRGRDRNDGLDRVSDAPCAAMVGQSLPEAGEQAGVRIEVEGVEIADESGSSVCHRQCRVVEAGGQHRRGTTAQGLQPRSFFRPPE